MLADWLGRYHTHPLRNTLTDDERELLTVELTIDPTTRSYAALSEGPALDVWAALKTTAMLASALGIELELPGTDHGQEQPPARPDELAQARARLRRHSAIADLPEE